MGLKAENLVLAIFFGPLILASVLSSLLTMFLTDPPQFLLMGFVVGFMLFAVAKLSVLKEGQFFSFGWSSMSGKCKMMYLSGYILMMLCALIAGVIVL